MKVSPSIQEVAFDCPHCGAYTSQTWFQLFAEQLSPEQRKPVLANAQWLEDINAERTLNEAEKDQLVASVTSQLSGFIVLETSTAPLYHRTSALNLHLSQCFACSRISVWVYDWIIFPPKKDADPPNPDLPEDIRFDYEEASRIVNLSPRGAAALLRLAIQKLCTFLGEKGEDINADIASLVRKGLLSVVQKSLDSLRVIGNESVHPGTMNLKDDRNTANQMFKLVNIIAEQMISNPKQANEVYDKLPHRKREAINKRDSKIGDNR